MKFQLIKSKTQERRLTDVLASLSEALARLAFEEADRLAHDGLLAREQHEAVLLSLSVLRDVRADVDFLAGRSPNPRELVFKLGELSSQVSLTIAEHSRLPQTARAVAALARVVFLLNLATERITHLFPIQAQADPTRLAPECTRVLLPSNPLYLYHYCLFPAERMVVVAGSLTPSESALVLGAPYDVTLEEEGRSSRTHVKADPEKLRKALQAMDYSGTRLAAWAHSHPGFSSNATYPSDIDTRQHAAWIADFDPNLLSLVMVESGFFRCFGNAIESGHIKLCIQGQGVIKEEEEHVYRLTQEG